MRKIFFLIFTISTYVVFTSHVSAQEASRSLTISPPATEVTLNPGERSQGVVKISNNSNEMLTFTVVTEDFIVQDTKGTPEFLAPNALDKRFAAASWITISPSTFSLPPNRTQEVSYSIDTPSEARPGGHYAAVLFQPQPNTPLQTGAAVETRLAALFSITIRGEINEEAIINRFSTPLFQEYGPIKTKLEIKNNGDTHIKPSGKIILTDIFGRSVAEQAINTHNIFPGAIREFENTLSEKRLFGKYEVKFTGTYGKNALPLTATTTFFVIPWKLMLIFLLTIICIILFLSLVYPFSFFSSKGK